MDGIKTFLTKETAGMPNWVWGLVAVAGIAAAIIVPKLLNKNSSSSTDTSSTDTSGQGLGLAIDPTTGLPYAVEGLVPSGAGAGGGGGTVTTPPPPPPTPTPAGQTFTITAAFKQQYGGHTLHQIASMYGITYDQLYAANSALFGTDKNHAKYSVGDVLNIPTSNPPKTPAGSTPQVQQQSTVWPGNTTQARVA